LRKQQQEAQEAKRRELLEERKEDKERLERHREETLSTQKELASNMKSMASAFQDSFMKLTESTVAETPEESNFFRSPSLSLSIREPLSLHPSLSCPP